jgi:hypothetical protein
MDFTSIKALTTPDGDVAKIAVNGSVVWVKPADYVNLVPLSVDIDGTPYNGGLGYKNGYRVRSGGAEAGSQNNVCTGFIPYKAGDVLEIYSPKSSAFTTTSYINVSDSSKANIGQVATNAVYGIFNSVSGSSWSAYVTELDNGVRRFVVPMTIPNANNIAFVRVTIGFGTTADATGDGMIIAVNEEIPAQN